MQNSAFKGVQKWMEEQIIQSKFIVTIVQEDEMVGLHIKSVSVKYNSPRVLLLKKKSIKLNPVYRAVVTGPVFKAYV